MKTAKIALFLAFSGLLTAETIIINEFMLFGQRIDIDQKKVSGAAGDSIVCNDAGMDFFFGYDDACCLAINCCCGVRVSSFGDLYLSRKPYAGYDFKGTLALTDTSLFRKVTPLVSSRSCSTLPSLLVPSQIGYGTDGAALLDSMENHFFILETREGLYAMVKIERFEIPAGGRLCYSAAQVMFVLQTDGSPFFDINTGITVPVAGNGHATRDGVVSYYRLDGTRIIDCSTVHRMGVILEKTEDKGHIGYRPRLINGNN